MELIRDLMIQIAIHGYFATIFYTKRFVLNRYQEMPPEAEPLLYYKLLI